MIEYFMKFTIGALGGLVAAWVYLAFVAKRSVVTKCTTSPSDVIALSNTYIVFTTFIFVVFSVALVILSIYVSAKIKRAKEEFLKENTQSLIDLVNKDEAIKGRLIEILANDSNFVQMILITVASKNLESSEINEEHADFSVGDDHD